MTFPRKALYKVNHAAWRAVDLLFPPRCAGCNALGERFCPECRAKCLQMSENVCVLCGKRHEGGANACGRVEWLDEVYAWGLHRDPLRRAVLGLKYRKNLALGDALCQFLFEVVGRVDLQADVVAPIPLSVQRERERGYNQAG